MKKQSEKEFGFFDTAPDTGTPLWLYEEYTFPKYSTDETREQSLIDMSPSLVSSIVSLADDYDPQEIFDSVVNEYDINQFPNVKLYLWRLLPSNLQNEIDY
jgi:hypothetical protein